MPQSPLHISIFMSLDDDRWLTFNDDIAAFNKTHDLPRPSDDDHLLESWLDHILQATYQSADLLFKPGHLRADPTAKPNNIEISVTLCDDKTIHDINRNYRGKDKPTNILSFAALEGDDMMLPPMQNDADTSDTSSPLPTPIGDLILSYDRVIDEAQDQAKPKLHHFMHLIIHGCLHLMGHDHIDESQANIMESIEIDILSRYDVKTPYHDTFSMAQLDA